MTVARILADKGHDVATIRPDRTLMEASRTLSEKRIGSLVVTDADGDIRGILSERDIVHVLARSGPKALDEPVADHMTTSVVTCTPNWGLPDLMERMTAGRFRHIPVIERGRLSGIVSIGDVVKWRLAEIETEHQALKQYIASA